MKSIVVLLPTYYYYYYYYCHFLDFLADTRGEKKQKNMSANEYKKLELIGKGSFGCVYKWYVY